METGRDKYDTHLVLQQHTNFIQTIVYRMTSENKKQEWKLRIAFAPCRDYKYHQSVKFDAEPCDFTHRFTEPNNLLRRALICHELGLIIVIGA